MNLATEQKRQSALRSAGFEPIHATFERSEIGFARLDSLIELGERQPHHGLDFLEFIANLGPHLLKFSTH